MTEIAAWSASSAGANRSSVAVSSGRATVSAADFESLRELLGGDGAIVDVRWIAPHERVPRVLHRRGMIVGVGVSAVTYGARREGGAMADVQTLPSVEEVEAGIPPEIEAYEIVDGRVLLTVGATRPHQHVIIRFGYELTGWAMVTAAEVLPQPFDVRTTPTRQRQPDLLVVLAEHRDRIGHGGMEGPPDLVVEVLSPSTRAVDLGEKRAEYAGIGVGEYLCIDPETGETFTASPPDAPWRRLGRGDVWRSAVLDGFAVPVDRLLPPREP